MSTGFSITQAFFKLVPAMIPSAYCSSAGLFQRHFARACFPQRGKRSKRIARVGKRGGFVQADKQNIHAARHLQNFLENYLARLRAHVERDPAAGREAESAIGSQIHEGSATLAEHLRPWWNLPMQFMATAEFIFASDAL
jgi:hypothetical protein